MNVIYCLILTAWQWLMSFTCIPVQTEPNKSPLRERLLALLLWEISHLSSPSRPCLGRHSHPWRGMGRLSRRSPPIGHHWGDRGLLNSSLESSHKVSDLNTKEGSPTGLPREARRITKWHNGASWESSGGCERVENARVPWKPLKCELLKTLCCSTKCTYRMDLTMSVLQQSVTHLWKN